MPNSFLELSGKVPPGTCESVDASLSSLVPGNETWFKHGLSNKTDNLLQFLVSVFHVTFASKGPGLENKGSDLPCCENWAVLHFGSLYFR